MRAPKTLAAAVALTAVTGLSLAACGSSNNSSTTPSSSSPSSAAMPITLSNITGQSTAVKLDSGFTAALKSLGLTPGVVGNAKLADGSISFPITSGNVTYYKPGTQPAGDPYVQGKLDHKNSGLSLTAGSTMVDLTNFVVDPGTSMLSGDVTVNGGTPMTGVPLFLLDGSDLQALDTSSDPGHAILTGTKVKILPAAATLLGTTFKAPGMVPADLLVGVATITLTLPASG